MKIILTEEAKEDVLRATEYYGQIRNRHGLTFDEAFEQAAKKFPTIRIVERCSVSCSAAFVSIAFHSGYSSRSRTTPY